MKINVYSIKDTKTAFMSPMFQHSDDTCLRDLKFTLNEGFNSQNFICRNFRDCELWQLGSFDDITGELVPELRFVARLQDLKEGASNGTC